jgi:hypothetical protein
MKASIATPSKMLWRPSRNSQFVAVRVEADAEELVAGRDRAGGRFAPTLMTATPVSAPVTLLRPPTISITNVTRV